MENTDRLSQAVYYQLADLYDISAIYQHNNRLIFRARAKGDPAQSGIKVRKRLLRKSDVLETPQVVLLNE